MKVLKWVKHRLLHKLEHLRWSSIKQTLREHGMALVIIIVGWEIIEDVLFPILFVWLGTHVHSPVPQISEDTQPLQVPSLHSISVTCASSSCVVPPFKV